MSDRGTGRTYRMLRESLVQANEGKRVLVIASDHRQVQYMVDMAFRILMEDLSQVNEEFSKFKINRPTSTFQFPSGILQITSSENLDYKLQGFRGEIQVDHHARDVIESRPNWPAADALRLIDRGYFKC